MSKTEQQVTVKQGLLDYLKPLTPEDRDAFAERIGTSVGHLKQIGYGNRTCNPEYAVNIDRETGRKVTMQEMCPEMDWDHVLSAMRHGEVVIDWDQVKQMLHESLDQMNLSRRIPLRRRGA